MKMKDTAQSRPAGMGSNIDAGVVARVGAGLRSVFTGLADWFGPGAPQPSQAPEQVRGRQFQMPVGTNLFQNTKTDGVSFVQLRQFADACEIVRLLIETRKDQVCNRPWALKVIEDKGQVKPARGQPLEVGKEEDPRIKELTTFFKKPDRTHTWSEWLRMLLEDLLVLDAPSIYLHKTNGGELYALRPIDGGTIKRVIDANGWIPEAPDPAYQQILNGVIASSYTTQELIYKPRNIRTNRVYGYGVVEQIIITARQWMSRQASNIEYYENGNLPEGFLEGAAEWTPEQLKDYQELLDSMLTGNYANKRKARVVPNGSKYTAVKEPALKQEFDEWLARIACFAFSVAPTPFIKQMNRSTSDNAAEQASDEGTEPTTNWIKELMDDIIQNQLGHADIEFVFEDKEAADPLERANIDCQYITAGVLHADEVRAEMGLPPLPPPPPTVIDADGNPVVDPFGPKPRPSPFGAAGDTESAGKSKPGAKPQPKDDKAQKLAKVAAEDSADAVDLDTPEAIAKRKQLADEIGAALSLGSEEVAAQIAKFIEQGETSAAIIAQQIALKSFAEIEDALTDALTTVAQDSGAEAIQKLGVAVDIDLINEPAVDWAGKRAAELIGKGADGGELLEATRTMIRGTIQKAVSEGWSNKQLAKELESEYAFSKQRAMVIARTELASASIQGSMTAWVASGVVKRKIWLLSNSEGVCEVCGGNADEGEVPLLTVFKSGDLAPPSHPNCRCSVAPITK